MLKRDRFVLHKSVLYDAFSNYECDHKETAIKLLRHLFLQKMKGYHIAVIPGELFHRIYEKFKDLPGGTMLISKLRDITDIDFSMVSEGGKRLDIDDAVKKQASLENVRPDNGKVFIVDNNTQSGMSNGVYTINSTQALEMVQHPNFKKFRVCE
ncbi:MAG: hypothetical protein HY520_01255 [Candidatus Aenigmarchaeota archaeon]|nr:hypothetical protein [Candidatus Aenigmarchaeota archaeon]